ncbi:MAG: ATP-grasp fold amidoligase family protein [Gemmatimonadales bacterium]
MNDAPTFSERLAKRKRIWWQKPRDYRDPKTYTDFVHQIRERHVLRDRFDPDERWRCCGYWQRSLSNKWNARQFAQRHGLRVPELYWHGRDLSRLDMDALPRCFVIRPTFGCSQDGVFVICDGVDLLSGAKVSRRDMTRALGGNAKRLLMGPILVEEFVGETRPDARLPLEFKLHMFKERVGAVSRTERSSAKNQTRVRFYSPAWEPLPDRISFRQEQAGPVPAPRCLPELLRAGKRLGQAYGTYVRVDFLVTGDKVVFGEFATTPGGLWTAFADEYFGRLWQESCPEAL